MTAVVGMTSPAAGSSGLRLGHMLPRLLAAVVLPALLFATGCTNARMLRPDERHPVDRSKVEYPAGFQLERFIIQLTAPTAFTFDSDGNIVIAGGGLEGGEAYITAFRPDGTRFEYYPRSKRLPLLGGDGFGIYGPVGGLVSHEGWIYVSHKDARDMGVISRLNAKGQHETVVAGLPAQGEHGVTDMAVDPRTGRLFFGVGTATNSGVVGLDDFDLGWVKDYPKVHDIPWKTTKLLGRRMNSRNPRATPLLGIGEISVSAPFQPFGVSNQTTIEGATSGLQPSQKFNGGIFSIPLTGGDLRAEAHGIRYPRGLAFNEYGQLYFTNNGMELRGSRPVKDDPDAFVRMIPGTWYGWPDYTTDFRSVTDPRHQPPRAMVDPTGYPDIGPVIDLSASGLVPPNAGVLLQGAFPSQSGAAGVEFVPTTSPFREFAGSAIVALSGDRAPFGTGGQPLAGLPGYKVSRVDVDRGQIVEFIRNTSGLPNSKSKDKDADLLERPIDVVFGPDGSLYVLDFGQMRLKDGRPDVKGGTGKVYRLRPATIPTTQPLAQQANP